MPNILQKIIGFIQGKSYYSAGQTLSFGDSIQKPTNADYLDAYEASFLVNACVDKISKKVGNTKFKLYKVNGRAGTEKINEVFNHPLLDLLAQVNPFTTKFAMLELTQTYLELLGNAYWLKVRADNGKKILELWALRPDWVTIKQDENTFIKYYEYRLPGGETQKFMPDDIIHFKQVNPKSAIYGLPTIKAVMDVVRTSIYAIKWNMNFFNNSAVPDTILISKIAMTPAQKLEFKEGWNDKYQGYKNAHKLGFLGGEVEFKQLMMSMRDMEFDKLTEISTQQILVAFGVPKAVIGLQGMNRAEAEAQIYTFLSETIEPKIKTMVESLNEFLVPEYGENLYLDFVDPTPENREAIIKEHDVGLRNNSLLINEVRDMEGRPPIKGGWDIYLPLSMIPVGGNDTAPKGIKIGGIKEKDYYKAKQDREQDELREKVLTGKRSLKLKMQLKKELVKLFIKPKLKNLSKEQKEAHWKVHDKELLVDERLFVILTRRLLKSQEDRTKETLESDQTGKSKKKAKYDIGVNWDVEDRIFMELSIPVFTDIIKKRGQQAAELVGSESFYITERVQKFIDKKAFKFANEVNKTTKKKLRKTLSEGISEGESINELSVRVAEVFKIRKGAEAKRIARTEVLSASNEATLEAYNQSDTVEKKEWLATMDDRVRDWHATMNGEVVEKHKKFSNGLMFPGDPSAPADEIINCRCALLPYFDDVDE